MSTLEKQLKSLLHGDLDLEKQRNLCEWIERIEDGSAQADELVLSRPALQQLIKHLCSQELKATSRRWTGLLLFKLITKSTSTMEQLGKLGHDLKRGIGHLLSDQNEILRRLAGQVVHVAMSAGQEIGDFFTDEQATQFASAYSLPRSSQWATQFDADLDTEAYVAATVAVDKKILHNAKEGTIVCQVLDDQLYCARFPFDNDPLFLDIPIKRVQSIKYEQGKEASPTGNLVLALVDDLHDNHYLNAMSSRAEVATIKFIFKRQSDPSDNASEPSVSEEAKDLMALIKPKIPKPSKQSTSSKTSKVDGQTAARKDKSSTAEQRRKDPSQSRSSDQAQVKPISTLKKSMGKTPKSDSQATTASSVSTSSQRAARAQNYLNVSNSSPPKAPPSRREDAFRSFPTNRTAPPTGNPRVDSTTSVALDVESQPQRKMRVRGKGEQSNQVEDNQQAHPATEDAEITNPPRRKMRELMRDEDGNLPELDQQVASASKSIKTTYSNKLKSPAKKSPVKSNDRSQASERSIATTTSIKGRSKAGKDKQPRTTMDTFDLPEDDHDDDVPEPANTSKKASRTSAKSTSAKSKSATAKQSSKTASSSSRPSKVTADEEGETQTARRHTRRQTRSAAKSGKGYKEASDDDIENDNFNSQPGSSAEAKSKPADLSRGHLKTTTGTVRERPARTSVAAAKPASAPKEAGDEGADEDEDDNNLNAAMAATRQKAKRPLVVEETQDVAELDSPLAQRLPSRNKALADQNHPMHQETVTPAQTRRAHRPDVMPRVQTTDETPLPAAPEKLVVIGWTPRGPANQGTKRPSITQGRTEIAETQKFDEEYEDEHSEQPVMSLADAHHAILHEAQCHTNVNENHQDDDDTGIQEHYSDVEAEEVQGLGYHAVPTERDQAHDVPPVSKHKDHQGQGAEYEATQSMAIGDVVSQAMAKSKEISQDMHSDGFKQVDNDSAEADYADDIEIVEDSVPKDGEVTIDQLHINAASRTQQAKYDEDTLNAQLHEARNDTRSYWTDSGRELIREVLSNNHKDRTVNDADEQHDSDTMPAEEHARPAEEQVDDEEWLADERKHAQLDQPQTIDPSVLTIALPRNPIPTQALTVTTTKPAVIVVHPQDIVIATAADGQHASKRVADADEGQALPQKRLKMAEELHQDNSQEQHKRDTARPHRAQHEDESHAEDDIEDEEDELSQQGRHPVQQHDSQTTIRVAPNGSPLPVSRQPSSQINQPHVPDVRVIAAVQTVVRPVNNDSQGFASKRKSVVFSNVVQERQTSEFLAPPSVDNEHAVIMQKHAAVQKQKDVSQDLQASLSRNTRPATFEHVEPQHVPEAVLDPRRRPPEPIHRSQAVDETAARQASVALVKSQSARPDPQAVEKVQKSQGTMAAAVQSASAPKAKANNVGKSLLESAKAEVRSVPVEDPFGPFGPPLANVEQRSTRPVEPRSMLVTNQDANSMGAIPRASQMPPRATSLKPAKGPQAFQQNKQNIPPWQRNGPASHDRTTGVVFESAARDPRQVTREGQAAQSNVDHHAKRLKAQAVQPVSNVADVSAPGPAASTQRRWDLGHALSNLIQRLEADLGNKIYAMIMQWGSDEQLSGLIQDSAALRTKVTEAKALYLEDRRKRRESEHHAAPPLMSFQQRLQQAAAAEVSAEIPTVQRINTIAWDDDEPTLVNLPMQDPQSPTAPRGKVQQSKHFSSDLSSERSDFDNREKGKQFNEYEDEHMHFVHSSDISDHSSSDEDEDDSSPTLVAEAETPSPQRPAHEAALLDSLDSITTAYTSTVFSHATRTVDLLVSYESGGIKLIDELAKHRHEQIEAAEMEFGRKRKVLGEALMGVKAELEKQSIATAQAKSLVQKMKKEAARKLEVMEVGLKELDGLC